MITISIVVVDWYEFIHSSGQFFYKITSIFELPFVIIIITVIVLVACIPYIIWTFLRYNLDSITGIILLYILAIGLKIYCVF